MKLTVETVRGKEKHVLDFGTHDGKRHRKYFDTEQEAIDAKGAAEKETALAGKWWAAVRADEKLEMIGVFKQMRDAGVHPADVWQAYSSGETQAVKQRRTLREAIAETILAKREAGRKKRYVDELAGYLNKFALQREDYPLDRITPKDIDQWFATRKETGETRKSNLGRLSSLFGLALRRGYLTSNPCKSAEAVSIDRKPPALFPVERLSEALKVCRKRTPRFLRCLILGGLMGLRPDEAIGAKIHWKKRQVEVPFHSSKIRAWRIIDLTPPALRWLSVCPTSHRNAILSRSAARRTRRKLLGILGIAEWPQDVLRHTAASHLLAFYSDEAKVASILGTSPRVLHARYKNVVSKADARKFMRLKP